MFTKIQAEADYSQWIDANAHRVALHLQKHHGGSNDSLEVAWIAAPYMSLWTCLCSGKRVWVLHNDQLSDSIVEEDLSTPRQVMAFFANRWANCQHVVQSAEVSCYGPIGETEIFSHMNSMARIITTAVEDDQLWEDDEDTNCSTENSIEK